MDAKREIKAERQEVQAPATLPQRLRTCVAYPAYGVGSEVWIERQLASFENLDLSLLCWDSQLDDKDSLALPLYLIPHRWQINQGATRWLSRLRRVHGGNFFGSTGRELRQIIDVLNTVQAEAILCHFGPTALRVLPAAQALGIPIVAHFHGFDLSQSLRNRWYRWSLHRWIDAFTSIVVVGSNQLRWVLDQGIPEDRVHLIPCGAPTDNFDRCGSPYPARPHFITVSRLVPWKGVDYSLRAFASASEQGLDATLQVIGDGPELNHLKTLAMELGVSDAISFSGMLPPEEVKAAMGRASALLQHSLDHSNGWVEGFGVSITEASAMELPSIVTPCGGIADQVLDGETGIIVPQRDVASFAAAIKRLGNDANLCRQLGTAARRRAIKHFDTAALTRRLEAVITDVAQRHRNRACR